MKDNDQIFLERVRAKTANLYEEADEPVPESYAFNNVVKGEVIRRFRNELSGTNQYDVSFRLNGALIKDSVQMSLTDMEAFTGNQHAALYALARAFAVKLTENFMVKMRGALVDEQK